MFFCPFLNLYQAFDKLGLLDENKCVRLVRFKTCRTTEAKAALLTTLELHLHLLLFRPCHRLADTAFPSCSCSPFDDILQLWENKRGSSLYLDMIFEGGTVGRLIL